MPDLRKTRKQLKIALAVMAGVDLLALIIYFSPLIGSAESRRQELNRLQLEETLKTQSVAPLRNLPEKWCWQIIRLWIFTTSASLPRTRKFPRSSTRSLKRTECWWSGRSIKPKTRAQDTRVCR
jgi:hypothetical protein